CRFKGMEQLRIDRYAFWWRYLAILHLDHRILAQRRSQCLELGDFAPPVLRRRRSSQLRKLVHLVCPREFSIFREHWQKMRGDPLLDAFPRGHTDIERMLLILLINSIQQILIAARRRAFAPEWLRRALPEEFAKRDCAFPAFKFPRQCDRAFGLRCFESQLAFHAVLRMTQGCAQTAIG